MTAVAASERVTSGRPTSRRAFLTHAVAIGAAVAIAPAAVLAHAPSPATAAGRATPISARPDAEQLAAASAALLFLLLYPTLRRALSVDAITAAFTADSIAVTVADLPRLAAAYATRFGETRTVILSDRLHASQHVRALLVAWAHLRLGGPDVAEIVSPEASRSRDDAGSARRAEAFADMVLAAVPDPARDAESGGMLTPNGEPARDVHARGARCAARRRR